jgi:hypothetical protein
VNLRSIYWATVKMGKLTGPCGKGKAVANERMEHVMVAIHEERHSGW